MSEEVLAADALLTANAVQRAQIAELSGQIVHLQTTIAEQEEVIADLRQALDIFAELLRELARITRDDESYLWRIGGRPLDEAYKAARWMALAQKASE